MTMLSCLQKYSHSRSGLKFHCSSAHLLKFVNLRGSPAAHRSTEPQAEARNQGVDVVRCTTTAIGAYTQRRSLETCILDARPAGTSGPGVEQDRIRPPWTRPACPNPRPRPSVTQTARGGRAYPMWLRTRAHKMQQHGFKQLAPVQLPWGWAWAPSFEV